MTLKVRNSNRFSVVPDAVLENKTLSLEARLAAAWLCGRQDGFNIRVEAMREYFLGISEKRWSSIKKELVSIGWWRSSKSPTGPRGQFVWSHEFSLDGFAEVVVADVGLTIPPSGMDGQSMPAASMHAEVKDNQEDANQKDSTSKSELVAAVVKQHPKAAPPAYQPGSCASGAPAGNEGGFSAFNSCLDRLRRNGSLVKNVDVDLERDRCTIEELRALGEAVGYDRVLSVIQSQRYPDAALKACHKAGLGGMAGIARRAAAGVVGDANRAKLVANAVSRIGAIPYVPRANGNLLEIQANKKKAVANATAGVQQ